MDNDRLQLFIRFGVHKDRDVLQTCKSYFDGLVIPAHILAYSPEPTVAAITYIGKPFFSDPMTYVFKYNYKQYMDPDQKKFKPSIQKLAIEYGLSEFFEQEHYRPLIPTDFTGEFIDKLLKQAYDLQFNKVNNIKVSSIKRYEDLLKRIDANYPVTANNHDYKPEFFVLPYFDFNEPGDEWFKVNVAIYNFAKIAYSNVKIVPVLTFPPGCLYQFEDILSPFNDTEKLLFWVQGFNEIRSDITEMTDFINFVQSAHSKNIKAINLYGTYLSVLTSKYGLYGLCHGIFYGEKKKIEAQIGGVPLSRYYIKELHEFYPIPHALSLIKTFPDLLCNCKEICESYVGSDSSKIFNFAKDPSLAQRHFLCNRFEEITEINDIGLIEAINKIHKSFETLKMSDTAGILNKDLIHLSNWEQAFLNVTDLIPPAAPPMA